MFLGRGLYMDVHGVRSVARGGERYIRGDPIRLLGLLLYRFVLGLRGMLMSLDGGLGRRLCV